MGWLSKLDRRSGREAIRTDLHPGIVDIKCEVAIANLQGGCLVVYQTGPNNVVLRYNSLPA